MKQTKKEIENLEEIETFENYEWFVEVVRLNEGKTFGELALIKNDPRAANIFSLTECYFATLNKTEYEKVLKRSENKQISSKIDFFNKLPFLKHWTTT